MTSDPVRDAVLAHRLAAAVIVSLALLSLTPAVTSAVAQHVIAPVQNADTPAAPKQATKRPKKGFQSVDPPAPNCHMAPPCPDGCSRIKDGSFCEPQRPSLWRRLVPKSS